MKTKVAKALNNSHTYPEYRKYISDLLLKGKVTGNEQSESLIHYTKLNETRMNRLEKTIKVTEETVLKLKSLKKRFTFLVISEGWCADGAQLMPVFNKMANESDSIDLKIVFRDENEDLMNLFLTNGNKAIPKLIVVDNETEEVLGNWGPRPIGANYFIKSYTENYGAIDDVAKSELQMWYLHDKGISAQEELTNMMLTL